VVLDSCVFSKLFLQEPDHQEAVELITELSQRNIKVLVPSLFLYEVLSIAAASPFPVKNAYALITQYQSANLDIVELNEKIILKAIDICAHDHKKSGFPSFYDASLLPPIKSMSLKQKTLVMLLCCRTGEDYFK